MARCCCRMQLRVRICYCVTVPAVPAHRDEPADEPRVAPHQDLNFVRLGMQRGNIELAILCCQGCSCARRCGLEQRGSRARTPVLIAACVRERAQQGAPQAQLKSVHARATWQVTACIGSMT